MPEDPKSPRLYSTRPCASLLNPSTLLIELPYSTPGHANASAATAAQRLLASSSRADTLSDPKPRQSKPAFSVLPPHARSATPADSKEPNKRRSTQHPNLSQDHYYYHATLCALGPPSSTYARKRLSPSFVTTLNSETASTHTLYTALSTTQYQLARAAGDLGWHHVGRASGFRSASSLGSPPAC